MKQILAIIFLYLSLIVYSQNITINGKVIDNSTQKPLEYVNIYIKGTTIGTVSNIEGSFIIKNSTIHKNDTLIFSIIGYHTKELAIKSISKNKIIKLLPFTQTITKVTVNAKRTDPSEILKKAMLKINENVYDKTYQTKVFSRNFVQKDSVFVLYRKTLTNAISYKDDVWSRKGNIIADKYFSLKKNIFNVINNKNVDPFFIIAQNFDYSRYYNKKDIRYLDDNIVNIDTVIFSGNKKIYVVDLIDKSTNPRVLTQIRKFIHKNSTPYTVIFDKKSQNDIINTFEMNNLKKVNFVRYYIDASQNYNIIKSISYIIYSIFDVIQMNRTYSFVYSVSFYTNKRNNSILNHSVSYRKLLFSQKNLYNYYDISSLYEQFCYEPNFDINNTDTSLTTRKEWENTISYKYNKATEYGHSNNSFDKWNNAENFIKTDTFEQKAIDQIQHPEKYYDVDKFYAKLDSANNIKFEKEKRIKPKYEIPFHISGTIIDSVTYEPLAYSNIILKNINDTTKKIIGAMTNEDGEFNIAIPLGYKYSIQISQLGYKTLSDTFDIYVDNDELEYYKNSQELLITDAQDIALAPQKELLQTVTVKGNTKTLDIDKQSTIVIPEMRKNTIATKDLFDKVDGITFNKITEDIKVDGSKKVKLLVDGVDKDNDYILNLNPKRVKKIEILRNISGLYATEGYKSIVNIITYDNYRGYDFTIDDQYLKNLTSVNKPYFKQNNASVNLNITRDKWNYHIKAYNDFSDIKLLNRSITNFTNNDETIINGNNNQPNNLEKGNRYGINLGVDYKINKKHSFGAEVGVTGFPAYSENSSISFDTLAMNGINTIMQNTTNNNSTYNALSGNLYYNYKINPTAKLISYLYLTNVQTASTQNINNEKDLNYKQTSDNLNYKIEYNKTFKHKYTLTTGGRYLSNNYKSIAKDTIQTNFENSFSKFTGFAFLKIKFNKNTGLLMGSSYEVYKSENNDFSTQFNSFQPKLDLYKTIKKNHKLVLEYSLKTQYPYLSNMNPQINYVSPFIASMGNPDLKPYLYHNISFQYSKISDGILNYFSIKPYYNYSDNEMGISPITHDSLIIYQNKNFVKHEMYGVYTSLSLKINKKLNLDFNIDVFKDWNKNLNTLQVIDWYGDAQITYSLNTKHNFGLMYQKEYAKNVTSLGYTKSGVNYFMIYWKTLQLKGRLQFMLGYSLPILSNQINEDYEETPYYIKHNYTDVSIINNMIMVNFVFRLSKGKVQKSNNNIDYEDYGKRSDNNKINL